MNKRVSIFVVIVSLLLLGAAATNRTPLLRAFLQSNLDGNGFTFTNAVSYTATGTPGFIGDGSGITGIIGGSGAPFASVVVQGANITVVTNSVAGTNAYTISTSAASVTLADLSDATNTTTLSANGMATKAYADASSQNATNTARLAVNLVGSFDPLGRATEVTNTARLAINLGGSFDPLGAAQDSTNTARLAINLASSFASPSYVDTSSQNATNTARLAINLAGTFDALGAADTASQNATNTTRLAINLGGTFDPLNAAQNATNTARLAVNLAGSFDALGAAQNATNTARLVVNLTGSFATPADIVSATNNALTLATNNDTVVSNAVFTFAQQQTNNFDTITDVSAKTNSVGVSITAATNGLNTALVQQRTDSTNDLNTALLAKLVSATNNALTLATNNDTLISQNATNQGTVVSNGVVAHTVTVAGTANQIASSVGTAQTLAANPATTLSLANPLIAPGPISSSVITNSGLTGADAVATDSNGKLIQATAITEAHVSGLPADLSQKVITNDSRSLVLSSATNNLGTDDSATTFYSQQHAYTTNTITTGNGTATMDMAKTYALLSTNAAITISLANVPTAHDRASVLILTNSGANASTIVITLSGFSCLTNGVPTQTFWVTNLTAKQQVTYLSVNCYGPALTNAVATHFYNP